MPVNEYRNPRSEPGTWVVWVEDSGYSDESMRFATKIEADGDAFRRECHPDNVAGFTFGVRYEA